MQKVLITGGTGLVGTALCDLLKRKNIPYHILTRSPKSPHEYKWDIDTSFIDIKSFEGIDTIIHLSGAGIATHRWTDAYKKEIMESRCRSTALLYHYVQKNNFPILHYLGASAVGYYGDTGNKLVKEEDAPGKDFLSQVCAKWEEEHRSFEAICTVTIIRLGIVLSNTGGALPQLIVPAKLGVASYFGSGTQYFPWIDLADVSSIIFRACNERWEGIYNAVSPEEIRFKEFTKRLAKHYRKFAIPFPLPALLPKLTMGEQSDMLLLGQRVSSHKLIQQGYDYLVKKFLP